MLTCVRACVRACMHASWILPVSGGRWRSAAAVQSGKGLPYCPQHARTSFIECSTRGGMARRAAAGMGAGVGLNTDRG